MTDSVLMRGGRQDRRKWLLPKKWLAGYITYSELSAALQDIEKDSDRIKIDVVGKSAGGCNIYLLAISDRSTLERLDDYVALASFIADNPGKALVTLDEGQLDYRVPSYIQGNIHGSERGETDACLNLKNRGLFRLAIMPT